MSEQAEIDFMTYLLTTWGKTWHTWPDPTTPVPLGEPLLMWSLTGEGQANTELVAERDRQFVTVEDFPIGRVPFWSQLHAYSQCCGDHSPFADLGTGGL